MRRFPQAKPDPDAFSPTTVIEPCSGAQQRTPWKTILQAHWGAIAAPDFFTAERNCIPVAPQCSTPQLCCDHWSHSGVRTKDQVPAAVQVAVLV